MLATVCSSPLRPNHSNGPFSTSSSSSNNKNNQPGLNLHHTSANGAELMPVPPSVASQARFPPGCLVSVLVDTLTGATVVGRVDQVLINFACSQRTNLYKIHGTPRDSSSSSHSSWLKQEHQLQYAPDCPVLFDEKAFGNASGINLNNHNASRNNNDNGKLPATILSSFDFPEDPEANLEATTLYSIQVQEANGVLLNYHGIHPNQLQFRVVEKESSPAKNNSHVSTEATGSASDRHLLLCPTQNGSGTTKKQGRKEDAIPKTEPGIKQEYYDNEANKKIKSEHLATKVKTELDATTKQKPSALLEATPAHTVQRREAYVSANDSVSITTEETSLSVASINKNKPRIKSKIPKRPVANKSKATVPNETQSVASFQKEAPSLEPKKAPKLKKLRSKRDLLKQVSATAVAPAAPAGRSGRLVKKKTKDCDINSLSGSIPKKLASKSTGPSSLIATKGKPLSQSSTIAQNIKQIDVNRPHRIDEAADTLYAKNFGRIPSILKGRCLSYHVTGRCGNISQCKKALDHKPLPKHQRYEFLKAIQPAMHPYLGPIFSTRDK